MRSKLALWKLKIIAISIGFSMSFIALELLARIIETSEIFPLALPIECNNFEYPKENCIFRRKSNISGKFIRGRLPPYSINVVKKTNDIGQFSDIDLSKLSIEDKADLSILTIGDSFVEASQVNNKNTFHGRLNYYKTKKNGNVVSSSIGTAGNAFPQYIIHLNFAKNRLDLENVILIFVVIANDFDESFAKYKQSYPGAKFNEELKSKIEFKRRVNNFKTSLKRFFISNSSLSKYLLLNIKLSNLFENYPFCLINSNLYCPGDLKIKANIRDSSITQDKERFEYGVKSTEIFLDFIMKNRKSNLEKVNTIFVVDADRENIYNKNTPKNSFFEYQRKYFIKKATSKGFKIIDLEKNFSDHFKLNKKRFEFSIDPHWNELAHEIIAEEIANILDLKNANLKE